MGQQIGNLSSAFSSTFLPRDLFFIQNASKQLNCEVAFLGNMPVSYSQLPLITMATGSFIQV